MFTLSIFVKLYTVLSNIKHKFSLHNTFYLAIEKYDYLISDFDEENLEPIAVITVLIKFLSF